jgi:Flp pilus assembly pilin Flp
MIQAVELKLLELYYQVRNWAEEERGQTTSEYVAVTAVAVAIALTVIFTTLSTSLTTAVTDIANSITDFVASPGS